MPYSFSTGGGGQSIKATELIVSVFDQVEAGFFDALYPEILWREMLPAESYKTDINPGALNYVYRSRDVKGMGQFVMGDVRNIPRVGQTVGQITVPVLDAAVGATLTDSEARKYDFAYQSALATDYGEIMKKAADYHIERTFFFGSSAAQFPAFIDHPSISKIPVDAWANSTNPMDWVNSINDAITAVYMNSKTVHLPNRLLLPPPKIAVLAATPMVIGSGTAAIYTNVLDYLKRNNLYFALTGKELEIVSLRYLTGAGVGGVDRAMLGEWNARNFVMPFPMPYQLAQPVPIALGVDMFAEYVFGPFHPRYPGAFAYIDGI